MKTALDLDKLAREVGVSPPPLPLSDGGQEIAAALLDDEDREWFEATITAGEERKAKRRAFLEAGRKPALTTREKIIALMAWAETQNWRNATDYFAYRAFLGVAYKANKLVVGMSQYQLGEAIGVWNQAAWEIIRRLEGRGLIEREALPDDGERDWSLAYRYALAMPDDVLQSHVSLDTTSPRISYDSRDNATLVPDLFKGGQGLTKAALRYYEALDRERPQKEADLARKLHRNRSSVNRALKRLKAFGLAVEGAEGWLQGKTDLETLAEEHGTAEAEGRRRAYTESRREGYRAYLEARGGNGEGAYSQDVRSTKGATVPEAGEARRGDRRAALPKRSAQPISSDHGPGIRAERMETLGHDPSSLRSDARARQSVGGMGMGSRYAGEGREAACVGCGQLQTFTAPDLKPYSCAYCKGKFEFVDELAMAAA